jgi:hypothetical protein
MSKKSPIYTFTGEMVKLFEHGGKTKIEIDSKYAVELFERVCPRGKLPIYDGRVILNTTYPMPTLNTMFGQQVKVVASLRRMYQENKVSGSYLQVMSIQALEERRDD